ncbi:MAG: hypothetical protein ABIS27_07415, partial [Longimicrobiales bacterium]
MSLPLIGFLRLHRRVALALLGVVISSAIILPACGDSGAGGGVEPPAAEDMSITKSGVVSGQTITYTISVSNHGTASYDITVTDAVNPAPAGSAFTSFTGGPCTVVSALSYSCVVTVPANTTRQLVLILTVPVGTGGGVSNCASIPSDLDNSNNRACTENVVAASPSSITIVKNADPDGPQDFRFTSGTAALGSFDLDDDSDPALSNQKVFTNLTPGTYTFTETQVPGWDLISIVCTPSAGTTVSVPTATATIALTAGANITCTFTNKALPPTTGTITITKDAVPNSPQDFAFTSNKAAIAAFLLDDDADATLPNARTFANVAADTYIITETATPGWSLASIACTPAASVVTNIGAATATITLAGGANVSCLYTNVPVVPTIDAVSSTTSSSTSTTVTVGGTGFVSPSVLTLRNTATGVTSTPTITSLTSTQLMFSNVFGITTVDQNYTLEITGPNGAKSVAKTFTVLRSMPVVTALAVNPTAPNAGTSVALTLTGADFSSDVRITINVTPVNDPPSTITIENNALTVKTAAAAGGAFLATTAGRYDVRVQNGLTGTFSNIMSFTVAASATPATITSISPASPTGSASAQPITINGSNFLSSGTIVFRNTTTQQTIDCPSASCQVTSTTSAQIGVTTTLGIASTAQPWTVTVMNPGAAASNAFGFTVNPPTPVITALTHTPAAPMIGSPFTITVTGNNFNPIDGRIVLTDQQGCAAGCTIENNMLTTKTSNTYTGTTTVSGGTTRVVTVTVQNGSGPVSNGMTFTLTAPPNPAAFIVLTPSVLTVGINGTADFTASFLDTNRQPTTSSCPITFSTVDASGIVTVVAVGAGVTAAVTGRAAGTTGVRAACTSGAATPASFTGTVRVFEAPQNIASMSITPANVNFPPSATSSTFQYTATARDPSG